MQKTSVKGKNIHFQSKRSHNLETLGGVHKKMSHCWRLHYKRILENFLEKVHAKKVTTEKHRFATSKN